MRKIKVLVLTIVCLVICSCEKENSKYPIEKRYWDLNDYDNVIRHLRFGIKDDESLPTFDNPETRIIVEKFTDSENYNIILNDSELGLKYKNEVATKFFAEWQKMTRVYPTRDRKDHYIYEKEMLEVYHFGLGLQLKYFKLGNDEIIEGSDDPNSANVLNTVNSNIRTLISNYLNYLDYINEENSFSEQGKEMIATGVKTYFTELVNLYPEANFNSLDKKATLMYEKSNSENIKNSLNELKVLINSKKKPKTEEVIEE